MRFNIIKVGAELADEILGLETLCFSMPHSREGLLRELQSDSNITLAAVCPATEDTAYPATENIVCPATENIVCPTDRISSAVRSRCSRAERASGYRFAGFIGMNHVLDEGYIGNVAVYPEFRRLGIGRALVEAMTAEAEKLGLSFLTLEVRESNAAARTLYGKCGYRDVSVLKNYYQKPKENGVIMTLSLAQED